MLKLIKDAKIRKSKMRKIEVLPYNKKWLQQFLDEKICLKNIFRTNAVNIHHIGSTSVPGLAAKPIIDIMIEVNSLQEVDSKNKKMIELGYRPLGEYGIKNRRFFQKGRDNISHHVHIFKINDENIIRHLAFRDYLKVNKKRLKEYEEFKIKLADQYHDDIDSYCKGKDFLIKEIEKEALNYYKKL